VDYQPHPIDTSGIELPAELEELTETLAEHAHDLWAQQRIRDGWKLGPQRDDHRQETPLLVPYDKLPDSEKVYDRKIAIETLKAVLALGYHLSRAPQ
jgi:hypothetical protein